MLIAAVLLAIVLAVPQAARAACSAAELASRNPEKCVRKYALVLRRCIADGIAPQACDTSASAQFCSPLSAACTPVQDIDDTARVIYGDQPVKDTCRRTLFAQATKLIRQRLTLARSGRTDKLPAAIATCAMRSARRCATTPVLGAPCDGSASPLAAAGCVCDLAPDWVIALDATTLAGNLSPALLGHYDLSGSLFHYDDVPGLAAALAPAGFKEWRVGVGRWENTTQMLPSLTSGAACFFPLPEAFAPPGTSDLDLIAQRDWFTDDGLPVTEAMTNDDSRYALGYVRSALDVATALGATPYVSIDLMPRALAANRQPLRTDCSSSFTNRVSNVRPADPAVFAAAAVGLVKRIVEGDPSGSARAVTHWEIWNEPELPYFWDPSFETGLDHFFEMAAQTLVRLHAYRQGSPQPAVSALRFGLGSFAFASTAANVLNSFDVSPIPGFGFLPIDFVSFHSYDNDPLKIVGDIASVAAAATASQHYANVELVLAEWGPDLDMLGDATYAASIEPSLLVATVLALGAPLGLQRAHHTLFWDFYDLIAAGLLDHQVQPRPLYHAYALLHRLIDDGAQRLVPLGFADGRLDLGTAAVLAARDGAGTRVLFVNRNDAARTARLMVNGAPRTPASITVFDDPSAPPHALPPASPVITVPARALVLVELGT